MIHTLASHFQGTFAGAYLGDMITVARGKSKVQDISFANSQLMIPGTRLLAEQGRLESRNWQDLPQKYFSDLDTSFANSYQVILATLPIAVFFHDNCIGLRHKLLDLLEIWQVKAAWRDVTLAFAYAITQAITEDIHHHTFITETVSFIGETSSNLPQKLLKLDSLLRQRVGFPRVKTELGISGEASTVMAMILYSCLITPEDFRLTILHSLQVSNSPFVVTLVSALSGTINGILGIPATWQTYLSSYGLPQSQKSQYLQMLTLADGLLEQWSGLYELHSDQTDLVSGGLMLKKNTFSSQAIAAPDIIR
ncbi:MAG: hypothetical protein HRU34_20355 [Richelia sp.]|nr:hypothetical protein [Richelia sp.]